MAKNGGWSPDVNQVEATSRFIFGTECGKAKIYFLVRKGDILEIKNVITYGFLNPKKTAQPSCGTLCWAVFLNAGFSTLYC